MIHFHGHAATIFVIVFIWLGLAVKKDLNINHTCMAFW